MKPLEKPLAKPPGKPGGKQCRGEPFGMGSQNGWLSYPFRRTSLSTYRKYQWPRVVFIVVKDTRGQPPPPLPPKFVNLETCRFRYASTHLLLSDQSDFRTSESQSRGIVNFEFLSIQTHLCVAVFLTPFLSIAYTNL